MSAPSRRTSADFRSWRARHRPARFSATLTALAIVFALAYVFVLRTPETTPTPDVAGIQGRYTWRYGDLREAQGTFAAVAGGNAAGTMRPARGSEDRFGGRFGPLQEVQSAYDAGRRLETTMRRFPFTATHETNAGSWLPVWRVATSSPLDYQGIAAVVRSAVEEGDRNVGIKPLKQGDRKVWRAAMTFPGSNVKVVVDRLSGIVVWYSGEGSTFTAHVDWEHPPPAGETYAVRAPSGAKLTTASDDSYEYESSLAEAGRKAGFTPLESALAPDGYSLRTAATASWMTWWQAATGPGDHGSMLPLDPYPGLQQVAALYTRGLNWFTVQQVGPKLAHSSAAPVDDESAAGGARKLSLESTELQYGALSGETAYTWYEKSGPTLFVGDDEHMVSVTGALTRQELISLAEGLRPAR